MKAIDETIVNIIGFLGWILVCLGTLFSIWLFISFLSSQGLKDPLFMLFFFLLIFCSLAVGMSFVVLRIVIRTLKNIEKNTDKQSL